MSKPASTAEAADFAVAQLFANALEDQNVGVHAHADGQDDAGDAGQSEDRAASASAASKINRFRIKARTALAPETR